MLWTIFVILIVLWLLALLAMSPGALSICFSNRRDCFNHQARAGQSAVMSRRPQLPFSGMNRHEKEAALQNIEEALNLFAKCKKAVRTAKLRRGLKFERDFEEALTKSSDCTPT